MNKNILNTFLLNFLTEKYIPKFLKKLETKGTNVLISSRVVIVYDAKSLIEV